MRIEVPARLVPLSCERIRATFRSIDTPVPQSMRLQAEIADRIGLEQEEPADAGVFEDWADRRWVGAPAAMLNGPHHIRLDRAVAVRCSVRDCPGRAGWIAEYVLRTDPPRAPATHSLLRYVTPRGYVADPEEPGVFRPARRVSKQRRRFGEDAALIGRSRNELPFDDLAAPLGRAEMPAEARLLAQGAPIFVRCPSCQAARFLAVSAGEVGAVWHTAQRCGIIASGW